MKYFLIIMSCMLLDIIEPVGCSRDALDIDNPNVEAEVLTNTTAE